MFRALIVTLALLAPTAQAELISKASPHSVTQTAERLVAAVEGAGAKVVARVDHGAAAAGAGLDLPEAVLLIFGNPQVGTPIMQQDLRAGLVLPLRVLIHADGAGVAVTYQDPAALFAGLEVDLSAEAALRIGGALGRLTDAAVAQ